MSIMYLLLLTVKKEFRIIRYTSNKIIINLVIVPGV